MNINNTIINVTILEKIGDVNGIFDVIIKKQNDDDNDIEKSIIESLRYDREKNIHGFHILKENPNKKSSEINFGYTPTFYRQTLSKNKLPYKISDTIELIDTFSCIGSRFGLKPKSVFVEVYRSTCSGDRIWANIFYIVDSEIPACIIKVTTILKMID